MQERVGLKSLAKNVKRNLPFWIENAPQLPGLVHSVLNKAAHGQLELHSGQIARIEQALAKQAQQQRQRAIALALASAALYLEFNQFGLNWSVWLQAGLVVVAGYLLLKK